MDIVRFVNCVEKIKDKEKYHGIISTVAEMGEVAENLRRCFEHIAKSNNKYVRQAYGDCVRDVQYDVSLDLFNAFVQEAGILHEEQEYRDNSIEKYFWVEFPLTGSTSLDICVSCVDESNAHGIGSIVKFNYVTGYDDVYVLVGEIVDTTKIPIPYEDNLTEDGWTIIVTDVLYSENDKDLTPEIKNRIIKENRLVEVSTYCDIELVKQEE